MGRSRLTTTLALPPVRGTLKADAPLAPLVWFKAGGAAQWLFEPKDADDLSEPFDEHPFGFVNERAGGSGETAGDGEPDERQRDASG